MARYLKPMLCAMLLLQSALVFAKLTELDTVVAIVNDKVITASQLKNQLVMATEEIRHSNQELPPPDTLKKQVLEQLILQSLQLQIAERTGIHVDEATIDDVITQIASQNNMTIAQFKDALASQGVSYGHYRQRIKNERTISQLQQRDLFPELYVNDQELEQFMNSPSAFGSMTTEYRLGHILISTPAAPTPDQIIQAQRKAQTVVEQLQKGESFKKVAMQESTDQAALSGGDLGWRKLPELPQLFEHRVNSMKVGDVAEPIRSASGFHIIKLLEKRKAQAPSHQVKKTKVRHILIKNNALASESDAKNKLRELKFKIEQGDDFAQVAKAYSEDLASASRGGSLGWVTEDVLVPEFVAIMNTSEPNVISEPFASPFGWHILQVQERQEEDDGESYLRNTARRMIMQRKFEEKLSAWQRQLRDESYVKIL